MDRVLTYMKTRLLFQTSILSVLMIGTAVAQSDPPGRVARLNLATGAVSMLTQSTGQDWIPAQINYPLTSGDQVWTDYDGRAELHIGTAAIRLREETNATFTLLDDQVVQLQLVSGGLNIRVRNLYADEVFEVDTPNLALTIRRPGDYRIDVVGQQTKVIVWSGDAEISGDNRTIPLRGRDYATVTGYGQLAYSLMSAPGPDDFDRWAQDRDRRHQQQTQSARYVSPTIIGSEDLDLYGSWSEVPNLGPVWSPRVDPGWAPYKVGHWAWVEPWGWTWIDDAPWGFAPFHYGRWAYVGGSWAWVPGPPSQRAVYSPALVAWAGGGGGGGGFRISASIGSGLAWFALGPGEVYVPSHRASASYVTNVNTTNTVVNRTVINNVVNQNVTNITYVNQRAPGAVVGMSHSDMAAGRRGTVTVAPGSFQSAQVTAVAPVPAVRPMLQPMPRSGNAPVARPPAAVAAPSRPVVMRNRIPAAAARPVFIPATGAPPPARQAPAPSIQPAQPTQPPPADQGRRFPGRESETVRPAPPQTATPPNPPSRTDPERVRRPPPAETPAVTTPPQTATPPNPPSRIENPERVRRQPPVESPAVTPPPVRPTERPAERPAPPVERVERPQPRPERPQVQSPPPQTATPPNPPSRTDPERVRRPPPAETPAAPPPARPTERPAPPPERVERPQPRAERPINVPPPAARPEVRPEPRRDEPRRPEPKPEAQKEEKKEEKKKQ